VSHTRLDYIPGDSVFHRMHVIVKMAAMLSILILMFSVSNLWLLGGLVLTTVALYRASGVPWSYFKGLRVLVPALLVFLISAQGLWYSNNRTPLFDPIMLPFRISFSGKGLQANALTLYAEGVRFGVVLACRMLGMFLTFPLVFLTTPTTQLIAGLTEVGLPYQISFIFTTALRFIPSLHAGRERVIEAQRLRGMDLEKKGIVSAVRQTVPTIVPMITSALRTTSDLEVAIESRAFGAFDRRTAYRGRRFTRSDRNMVIGLAVGTLIAAVAANLFFPGR
jgi:energy-coupling factor transport system permease protein